MILKTLNLKEIRTKDKYKINGLYAGKMQGICRVYPGKTMSNVKCQT